MTDFIFATYSGVAWYQLATPWIGLVIFMGLGVWGWVYAIDQKNRADIEEDCKNLIDSRLSEKLDHAIEKQISLEATIRRLTERPRGKDGKFQKKIKDSEA